MRSDSEKASLCILLEEKLGGEVQKHAKVQKEGAGFSWALYSFTAPVRSQWSEVIYSHHFRQEHHFF